MRKVLFGINVVLDVLLDRTPHVEASAAAWAAVETGIAQGYLAAHVVTTIHHLVRKEMGRRGRTTCRLDYILTPERVSRIFGAVAYAGSGNTALRQRSTRLD